MASVFDNVDFDPMAAFRDALKPNKPWESIVDFACHRSFCGQKLYPRQKTLLKLIYLETEHMTAYDIDVIEEWRRGFENRDAPEGVQPDIWERIDYLKSRGYTHFPHVEAIIGRRGSKGKIGGVLGTERLAYMRALDDWQGHFGISPGKSGYLTVVATNSIQAKKFQFADIRETVGSCTYLQPWIQTLKDHQISIRTPSDERRIARMKADKVPIQSGPASIHAVAMSSNSSSGRGATGFANFYDEFAHMISGTGSKVSSEEVYEAYQPSLDQFGKDSMTYIPSSPFSQVGKFYSLYKQGTVLLDTYDPDTRTRKVEMKTQEELGISDDEIEEGRVDTSSNPEMLVVQLPSWGLYEDWDKSASMGGPRFLRPIQEYNERMMRLEQANPQKFSVERRAQFASVIDAYLDPKKVDQIFEPFWGGRKLEMQDKGKLNHQYRIHIDPSLTNANFALCIGHLEDAPPDEHGEVWPHVIIDYLKVWKPKDFPDHTIDYVQVKNEISEILRRFPSTTHFSADQWNSAGLLAELRQEFGQKMRIKQETFSSASNMQRMERLKSAINLGWVHAPLDDLYDGDEGSLLELEMKFLQRKGNRVDKQDFGPVTTKDLFDAFNVVVDQLLKDSLERWHNKFLTNDPVFGSTRADKLRSGDDVDRVKQMMSPINTRERLSALSRGAPSMAGSGIDRLRGR